MAKLTYQTDAGEVIEFDIAETVITDLQEKQHKAAMDYILKVLQEEIIARNNLLKEEQ